ncbi:hypothetical protein [Glutamicibacter sp. BW77]|uniref:hypothetical protein n=1 Tax=Glutamicibacter TaxID=1742989 RepID=UPI000BB8D38A|nr:hypothetical protein [Glutamicibacter sp. BW77]PCC31429.1 hypothetical protein CIK74_17290 [Glutamicibacter sp. BW77]
MNPLFICRRSPLGYWSIQYRDGQLLGEYERYEDALAQIRAIHGRTIHSKPHLTSPKACETKYKES